MQTWALGLVCATAGRPGTKVVSLAAQVHARDPEDERRELVDQERVEPAATRGARRASTAGRRALGEKRPTWDEAKACRCGWSSSDSRPCS